MEIKITKTRVLKVPNATEDIDSDECIIDEVECYDINDKYIKCTDCIFRKENFDALRESERGLSDV